ncbi:MAG: hypothetical protein VYE69_18030 [Pseudomonadota bacterium]|nr:hypothetical protein [Paracoccaceae bacterium]MEC9470222.1 hypothetical protein [Pseudomonadota bacterium]MEE2867143.1 hypothetical protein [Pseudomonadota bacterium]
MKYAYALAVGLLLGLPAEFATAQSRSNEGVTGQPQACPFNHPVGCFIKTGSKGPVKSVYFFNDYKQNRCGVHTQVCPEGRKCFTRTEKLSLNKATGEFYSSRINGAVTVTNSYGFSTKTIGAGYPAFMRAKVKYVGKSGKARTSTLSFKASSEGC